MQDSKLGIMEKRFADLIWTHAPVSSGELVKLCATEFDWKKSTTYTMLKRLCERGLFENREGVIVTLISPEEYAAIRSEKLLEEDFGGSLPGFLTAFSRRKKLSSKDIEELKKLIAECEEE